MGLNDLYAQARGNILMLNPLPGINHAYSLLLQDDNQREVYINPQFSPNNSSFMAKNFNSQMKLGNQMQKPGHPEDDCYRLMGYQEDFQFTKGFQTPINGNRELIKDSYGHSPIGYEDSDEHFLQSLSKSQISHMKQIFKQGQTTSRAGTSSEINANVVAGASEDICYEPTSFLNLVPHPAPVTINLPNSYRIKVL
ncbi:hypothetical protein KY290_018059 [Solanum tuberosum]|uniref:Uncharacterized protein n=1 Tax=Solanum tuberosum TaxID=4113 RepID=A0ABQ7VDD5_SOLTU|nr:hypothetical protein KY290_018059 [Solanum tuberosum]